MQYRIAFKSGRPLYLQLVDQIRIRAASGVLKPGTALPTIRPLAKTLHLNRNTVAKAYGMLERMGVIQVVPGKGAFIKKIRSPLAPEARQEHVVRKIDEAIVAAYEVQINAAGLLTLIHERLQFFSKSDESESSATAVLEPGAATKSTGSQHPARSAIAPNQSPSVAKNLASVPVVDATVSEPAEGWTPGTD